MNQEEELLGSRRTSHEVRGLKYNLAFSCPWRCLSHLTRGAWIEIQVNDCVISGNLSHLTRGAWIEMGLQLNHIFALLSHLTRGAWIEIITSNRKRAEISVAPHTRCVD